MGWRVIVIWECEVEKKPGRVMKKVGRLGRATSNIKVKKKKFSYRGDILWQKSLHHRRPGRSPAPPPGVFGW